MAFFQVPGAERVAAARDFAVNYARERRPSGLPGPIAELQTVQHRIAEIELLLLQSRAVLYSTAEAWLAHPEHHARLAWQLAAAKYLATNNAITNASARVFCPRQQSNQQPTNVTLRAHGGQWVEWASSGR